MSSTTNLSLPYLASGQAQKHVTVNESLQRLDALVQLAVASDRTAQPDRRRTRTAQSIMKSHP
jgi:hypothetical protein